MFQIRVQPLVTPSVPAAATATAVHHDEEAKTEELSFDQMLEDEAVEALLASGGASFLTGNPQVRISTGKLRFYRPDRRYLHGNAALHSLPDERNTLLCVVTVPSHMSPVELLEFLAGFRDDIQLVRILKDPERSNCMALLQFTSQDRADSFFLAHNGTYFNSIELERCKIVFVKSIAFDRAEPEPSPDGGEQKHGHGDGSDAKEDDDKDQDACDGGGEETKCRAKDDRDGSEVEDGSAEDDAGVPGAAAITKLFPPPPPGMTEIPTCAVCLDRLDASASGILTTLCNHTFHCDCLFRWEGSSCPVCRYSHGDIGSACEVCQTSDHLWICLICGHVGCGRYSNEHAKQHYQETMHTYSLELETQRVWDYAGDGFVHRLIMNKQDGKFVEFPSPQTMSGERSQLPPPTDAEVEEHEHRKLEKLAKEYNFLLKSQLEEQRLFYERRLASLHESDHHRVISALEHEKKSMKKSHDALGEKAKKLEEELRFVRELNKSLIENQKQWKERVQVLEDQNKRMEGETAVRIGDLEAQVRDLMFYLDTQSKVEQSAHREDIQGGTIQVEARPVRPEPTTSSSAQRRTRKKR